MKLYPPLRVFVNRFIDFSTIFYFLSPWRLDFDEFSLSKTKSYQPPLGADNFSLFLFNLRLFVLN